MKHGIKGRKLQRKSGHRAALFRNMAAALIKHEQITTTLPKAKDLRRVAERLITLAKRGDLHSRRQVLQVIRDKDVVHRLFDPLMEAAAGLGAGLDWKTSLQELSAEHSLGVPEYVIEDDGPDHEKTFTAQVQVGDALYGLGTGRSKKEAEQQAAETAYRAIAAERGSAGRTLVDDSVAEAATDSDS